MVVIFGLVIEIILMEVVEDMVIEIKIWVKEKEMYENINWMVW